jgi:hypothetical protein
MKDISLFRHLPTYHPNAPSPTSSHPFSSRYYLSAFSATLVVGLHLQQLQLMLPTVTRPFLPLRKKVMDGISHTPFSILFSISRQPTWVLLAISLKFPPTPKRWHFTSSAWDPRPNPH